MPLFGKRKKNDLYRENLPKPDIIDDNSSVSTSTSKSNDDKQPILMRKSKFSFQCQLAHGSPTGIISGFKSITELYSMIADCFGLDSENILFCTLNTHKIDMQHLLGSNIGVDDFIFAHIKGQKKEIDIFKSDESLGITITDNGVGKAFIKRIRELSPISKLAPGLVDIGDHIEKINNVNFIGKRHYDVAKELRSIEVGAKFTIRLISPEKSIYSNIKSRSESSSKIPTSFANGRKTLRLNAGGMFEEEDELSNNNMDELAIEAIIRLVEKALGISDNEMAEMILDIGKRTQNPTDFSLKLNEELGEFLFPEILLQDFWGVVTDAKKGLLVKTDNTHSTVPARSSSPNNVYANIIYEDRL